MQISFCIRKKFRFASKEDTNKFLCKKKKNRFTSKEDTNQFFILKKFKPASKEDAN